jgi:predicted RNase H-like HicB family nuclease/predicted RNA binding protein YcfA (HicA-like mRNA interferase family)
VDSRQLIKLLEADGWQLVRTRGSHHQFKHPKKPGLVHCEAPRQRHSGRHAEQHSQASRLEVGGTMRFPVVLHTDDGTHYGVTVPDLPGCFSGGDSIDDALDNVREAIDLHLEGLTEDGDEVPTPKPIAEHQASGEFSDGIWAIVDVDTMKYEGKAEKINITLPRRLLVQIDEYAQAHGESRSGFLAEAARAAMRR